ncbi:MAG: hypothetical protein CSA58_09940 [Micrococcales bacterium]|nr:MAG: hypothetical protein CSB46_08980 [Micrococcales bacterium]PIE26352.1 MAG: hypothetical protein CSA58_09940 [Micrococcales bacterium]
MPKGLPESSWWYAGGVGGPDDRSQSCEHGAAAADRLSVFAAGEPAQHEGSTLMVTASSVTVLIMGMALAGFFWVFHRSGIPRDDRPRVATMKMGDHAQAVLSGAHRLAELHQRRHDGSATRATSADCPDRRAV